jgi:hypothetical protein
MTTSSLRRSTVALVVSGLMALPAGCVAPGPGSGYAYDNGAGSGVDYYEPYGFDYGGWDSGYQVGPYRDHGRFGDRGRGNPTGHSYRSAPASRPMPSLPSGARSGGGRR